MVDKNAQEELALLRERVEELSRALESREKAPATPHADAINWDEALETIEGHVREHPVGSTITALVLGLVIGVVISR